MVQDFTAGELSGVRILVVDDEPDSRELLAELLGLCGAEVTSAASAEEALSAIAERLPAVLVSDINMPGQSGYDLVRKVRALPAEAGGLLPAIATSAGGSLEEALEAGFHAYLGKPYDPLRLLDLVRDFVGEDRGATAATTARWTIGADGERIVLGWNGHVGAADMRAAMAALVALLARGGRYEVVSDLRALSGFAPSVASVGQRAVWTLRHQIAAVRVLGGPTLARLVTSSSCAFLGIPCTLT